MRRQSLPKAILICVWGISVTLAVIYLQTMPSSQSAEDSEETATYTAHTTQRLSVALFRFGEPIGHIIASVSYELRDDYDLTNSAPVNFVIEDRLQDIITKLVITEKKHLKRPNLEIVGKSLEANLMGEPLNLPLRNIKLEESQLMLR